MRCLRPGLYVGDFHDSQDKKKLLEEGISHILTLAEMPEPAAASQGGIQQMAVDTGSHVDAVLEYLKVPLVDEEVENLLDSLPLCIDFIQKGRRGGGVLVHCLAGVSRSAAVATAYLMKSEQLSLSEALAAVRAEVPGIAPNRGFLDQLELFEEMRCQLDAGNAKYRRFKLERLGRAFTEGEHIEPASFAADPADRRATSASPAGPSDEQPPPAGTPPPSAHGNSAAVGLGVQRGAADLYKCRKCRRVVAAAEHVVPHEAGGGSTAFKWKKRGGGGVKPTLGSEHGSECSSIFVEPMRWMTTVTEGEVEGKLTCVKCKARLGAFCWAGMQCSCGAWVTPAFQLHKSRLDAAYT
eukprot:jgi/Mesen1/2333/ME000155S01426